jgi:Ni,Fe-hydrogenase III large subunit
MPLLEEPEFYRLHVDGETVVDVDLDIGYNHRGIEKLCEEKTYDQVTFVVERICGICSTSHPLAYVQAVEDVCAIPVPPRARYIRVLVAELERIHSHLLWLGLAGHFLGYNTVFMWAWKYREIACDIFERTTGNRQSYAMMKVGGVRRDISDAERERIVKDMDALEEKTKMFLGAVTDDPVLHARLKGVGVLPRQAAVDYCALGPTARGSGVPIDVRKDEPYAAYADLDWNICVVDDGDVYAKAAVRILETLESINMIRQAMRELPDGDIDSNPTNVPPGEGIGRVEAPRGECFHYIRSDGTNRPARHKARAPTFMNLPTFKVTMVGQHIADACIASAAIDPCYCCTERLTVVERRTGRTSTLTHNDLVRMSQQRTAELRRALGVSSA